MSFPRPGCSSREDCGGLLDRGYFSRCNIEFMDQKGIEFLMMVKGCKPLV